jgi:hypothetical protein
MIPRFFVMTVPVVVGKATVVVLGLFLVRCPAQLITAEPTYTLSCIDAGGTTLTKTATVQIPPNFQEL